MRRMLGTMGPLAKVRRQVACQQDSKCVIAVHFHHTEQVKGSSAREDVARMDTYESMVG